MSARVYAASRFFADAAAFDFAASYVIFSLRLICRARWFDADKIMLELDDYFRAVPCARAAAIKIAALMLPLFR